MGLLELLTGGASAITGGIVGTIGSIFSKWIETKQQQKLIKLQIELKKLENQHELAVMDREAENAERLARIQADERRVAADMESLQTSLKTEMKGASWSAAWADRLGGLLGNVAGLLMVLVDVMRGTTRPIITYYLVALTTGIAVKAAQYAPAVTPDNAFTLLSRITDMILFLTSVAVTWWFGTRPAHRSK